MISIRNEVGNLERCLQQRDLAVDCYVSGVRNIAEYAIELETGISDNYRKYLRELADGVASGEAKALGDSRANLRGLLRDFRDKATQYLKALRTELSDTARAFEEILGTLTQTDGDYEGRVSAALARLRKAAKSPSDADLRAEVTTAADSIQKIVEEIQKQHQLTISQFQSEVRMLHKRIDTLEATATRDQVTQVLNRHEIEECIRKAPPDSCVLLARVNGFRLAEVNFRSDVAAELASAFVKRLRNALTDAATVGRWSLEEFAAILPVPRNEATNTARWIGDNLSGSYSCLLSGKTVRPALQITVAVIEVGSLDPETLIRRVKVFLTAEQAGRPLS